MKILVLLLVALCTSTQFSYAQDYDLPNFVGQVKVLDAQKGATLEQVVPEIDEKKNKVSYQSVVILSVKGPFSDLRFNQNNEFKFIVKVESNSSAAKDLIQLYKFSNATGNRICVLTNENQIPFEATTFKDQYIIIEPEEVEFGEEIFFQIKGAKAISMIGVGQKLKGKATKLPEGFDQINVTNSFKKGAHYNMFSFHLGKYFNREKTDNQTFGNNDKPLFKGFEYQREIGIANNLGIAPFVGFGFANSKSILKTQSIKNKYAYVGVDLNIHLYQMIAQKSLADIAQDKLDIYLGLGSSLGYATRNFKKILLDSVQTESNNAFKFSWDVALGIRYFIKDNFAVYGEFGGRKSLMAIGVVLRPKNKTTQKQEPVIIEVQPIEEPEKVYQAPPKIEFVSCDLCAGSGETKVIGNIKCTNHACISGKEQCTHCDGSGQGELIGNKFNPATGQIEKKYEVCSYCDGSNVEQCHVCDGKIFIKNSTTKQCTKCAGEGRLKK